MTAGDFPESKVSKTFLEQNAREIFEAAPASCNPDFNCLNYHRLWPLARLARSGHTQLAGVSFIREQLAQMAPDKLDILIAGAADTGLLATIHDIVSELELEVHYILADRCATVISQNKHLGELLNISADYIQSDLLELHSLSADVIVGHSILNFFDHEQRGKLLQVFLEELQPNGKVLLTNTVNKVTQSSSSMLRYQFDAVAITHTARRLGFSEALLASLNAALEEAGASNRYTGCRPVEEELMRQIAQAGFSQVSVKRHQLDTRESGPVAPPPADNAVRLEICLQA